MIGNAAGVATSSLHGLVLVHLREVADQILRVDGLVAVVDEASALLGPRMLRVGELWR